MLFDVQDLLRRDILYYKGRLDMDQMEVLDVEDGKDKDLNVTVKNALKLISPDGAELHLLCAKKPELKQRWLRAFTDERQQVRHDRDTGETPAAAPKVQLTVFLLTESNQSECILSWKGDPIGLNICSLPRILHHRRAEETGHAERLETSSSWKTQR